MTLENQTVDNVSKKILSDAASDGEIIINEALAKEKEILATAEDRRKKIIKEAENQAKEVYLKVKELEIANAVMKFNQEGLLGKIKLIEEISHKALNKLRLSENEEYINFIENSIRDLKFSKADYQIGKSEKLITSEILEGVSKNIILVPSDKTPDFEKGIKIIDGRKQYIISIEEALKEKMEDIIMEISDILFEKE